MKKIIGVLLTVTMIFALVGCAGNNVRSRDGLPQSTRIDRETVAASSRALIPTAAATPRPAATPAPVAAATPAPVPAGETVSFQLHTQTDETHPLTIGLFEFKKEVENRSNGALLVDVSFGAGNDMDLRNRVINNELDAAVITIWSVWQDLTDYANLESLPFLFGSYEEAWAAYDGELGAWVTRNVIEPHGARVLGYWTNGLRHFTNNTRPIETPDDLRGLRMRSMQTTTHLAMYETFGAASMSMPFGQVHEALATGRVDGQDNPLGNIHAARLYEVQEYLTLSAHMYSCAPLIVSVEFWESLTAEHQQILLDASLVAARFQGELTKQVEEQQLAEIKAFGTKVNTVDAAPFKAAVEPIWEEHIERFGNEFVVMAARYVEDSNALVRRFSE